MACVAGYESDYQFRATGDRVPGTDGSVDTSRTSVLAGRGLTLSDDSAEFSWRLQDYQIQMTATNRTESQMRLLWNEARLTVDTSTPHALVSRATPHRMDSGAALHATAQRHTHATSCGRSRHHGHRKNREVHNSDHHSRRQIRVPFSVHGDWRDAEGPLCRHHGLTTGSAPRSARGARGSMTGSVAPVNGST